MSTDKMREEFEAAFAKKTASLCPADSDEELEMEEHGGFEVVLLEAMAEDRNGNTYRNNVFASAWWAWRASRDALVIEWPNQHTYTAPDCAGAAILDCRTAYSKALRLKVRP